MKPPAQIRDYTIILNGIPATTLGAQVIAGILRRALTEAGIHSARTTTIETWAYQDTLRPPGDRSLPTGAKSVTR